MTIDHTRAHEDAAPMAGERTGPLRGEDRHTPFKPVGDSRHAQSDATLTALRGGPLRAWRGATGSAGLQPVGNSGA